MENQHAFEMKIHLKKATYTVAIFKLGTADKQTEATVKVVTYAGNKVHEFYSQTICKGDMPHESFHYFYNTHWGNLHGFKHNWSKFPPNVKITKW